MNTARFCVILFFFGAAFVCCAVKGCRLAGPDREKILARGEKIARVWRQLPARRGRILDKNGKVLVWSELYCDLHYNNSGEYELSEDEQHALIELFGKMEFDVPPSKPLRRHLRPDELIALEPLLLKGAPLRVLVRNERLVCDSEAVRTLEPAGCASVRSAYPYADADPARPGVHPAAVPWAGSPAHGQ